MAHSRKTCGRTLDLIDKNLETSLKNVPMKELFRRFIRCFLSSILGLRRSSTPGSDTRRFFMRMALYWSAIYIALALFNPTNQVQEYSIAQSVGATMLITASLLMFFQIVLLMPFRDDGAEFKLDTRRLLVDTIVSSSFMIVAFSLIYKNIGLVSNGELIKPNSVDAIYFSAVTFSTLGYGDFAPHAPIRLVAAAQALLGNLHLGMIVGATFAAIKR